MYNPLESEIEGKIAPRIDFPSEAEKRENHECIDALWDAFYSRYTDYVNGEMKLEEEEIYDLFGAPGPAQYDAFKTFFGFFKDEEKTILAAAGSNYEYMYMHDFITMDRNKKDPGPALIKFMENLLPYPEYNDLTMVSGFFSEQHLPTRKKIVSCLKNLHNKNEANVRVMSRANAKLKSKLLFLSKNSRFGLHKRMPFHYLLAKHKQGYSDLLFYEYPHTESNMVRLNMFLNLDKVEYKDGIKKENLLQFLDSMIEKAE